MSINTPYTKRITFWLIHPVHDFKLQQKFIPEGISTYNISFYLPDLVHHLWQLCSNKEENHRNMDVEYIGMSFIFMRSDFHNPRLATSGKIITHMEISAK